MIFATPYWFALLAVALLLALLGPWWTARALQRDGARFGAAAPPLPGTHPGHVPPSDRGRWMLRAAALAAIALALAAPLYGDRKVAVQAQGADVVIAIDVSTSMAATDAAPDRLAVARRHVDRLLSQLPGFPVALVVFAGDGYLGVPLTLDHGAIRLFLDATRVGMVPRGGSSLEAALTAAVGAFSEDRPGSRAVVLLSDGEATTGDVDQAVAVAKAGEVSVFPVGIGSAIGVPVPRLDADGRRVGYRRDRAGRPVVTRLNPEPLRDLARRTNGRYHTATLAGDEVDAIVARLGALAQGIGPDMDLSVRENRYQWPLALAVLLLWLEGWRRRSSPSLPSSGAG